jgi:hypothetical protein
VTVIWPAFPERVPGPPPALALMPVAKLPDREPVPSIVSVPGTETEIFPALPRPNVELEIAPPSSSDRFVAVMLSWPASIDPKVAFVIAPSMTDMFPAVMLICPVSPVAGMPFEIGCENTPVGFEDAVPSIVNAPANTSEILPAAPVEKTFDSIWLPATREALAAVTLIAPALPVEKVSLPMELPLRDSGPALVIVIGPALPVP